jgi:hypothetical protein
MSATALAEYLILRTDKQENVLHDSRFSRPPIVTANGDAMRALRAYNWDPRRPQNTLDVVKTGLMAKAATVGIKPKSRDEALRCAEIIELFEQRENALGMRALSLSEPGRFGEIDIEGVAVSIQPDFLVSGAGGRIGAGLLRVAKAPDLEGCREETRLRRGEHRREMARYMVALLQMLLEAQSGEFGTPDRDLCFVADVRLGERIGPARDHTARLRTIRAACAQIVTLWPTISPRPSVLRKP